MKVKSIETSPIGNGVNFFLRLDSSSSEEMKLLESLKGKVVGSICVTFTDRKTGRGFLTILAFR